MPAGRPTLYTKEFGKQICEKIASRGVGLLTLCKENPEWPNPDTIYTWLRKHKEFADEYARAKKHQVLALVDEILEITDDSSRDDKYNDKGEVSCDAEWVSRSRLRVDTRKWLASKLVPKIYGDNVIARELAEEIEELKVLLENAKIRNAKDGKANSSKEEKDSKK